MQEEVENRTLTLVVSGTKFTGRLFKAAIASHDMAEVENLCDRIAILSEGKIAFIGTVEQLGETIGKHYNITIQTESSTEKYESDNIGETLLSLLTQYKEKEEPIVDIQINRGTLEQHFMRIAKGE